ncbi:hypothetical protein PVAND_015830 [Polypedilum vanderplanki]|uniref:Glucose-methanol-choline oxidoreductase N-terminal domain-containing protein n=1 Tax=Polypedilum vanderplanki TaxID=319348 RepID=A0A9J6BDP0_POLVA|nr:hypothetical protein PVAND_015830 [Polypedilum vanderplanki]
MKILAKFEVILAAGTFHSPQILILSGIGASEDLKRLKISQVVDLQVGKFLYDHPSFPGIIILTNLTSPFSNFFNPQTFLPVALDFINGKGLMTIANGIEALAFIKSQNSTTLVDSQPDIEIFSVGAGPQSDFGLAVKYGERLKDEIYDDWIKPLEYHPNHTSLMPVSLLHTKSVGFLEITSKNIFDNPKLTSNFLKEPEDMKMFIEGIRFVEKLIETPPYKAVDAKLYKKPITGCEMHEFGSESYWECAVRTFTVSLHHQLGTCKMGSENDKNSVVNSRLKVIGMKKLRIVDTSVVPAAASAHTNALSCMIGERATEFIREEYGV